MGRVPLYFFVSCEGFLDQLKWDAPNGTRPVRGLFTYEGFLDQLEWDASNGMCTRLNLLDQLKLNASNWMRAV